MEQEIQKIAFLGICEKADYIKTGPPATWRLNIIGLNKFILSYIFPLNLNGAIFLFGVHESIKQSKLELVLKDSTNKVILKFNFDFSKKPVNVIDETQNVEEIAIPEGEFTNWHLFLQKIDFDQAIKEPGRYDFFISDDNGDILFGSMHIIPIPAPKFSQEFIAALKSDPLAHRSVSFTVECSKCKSKLKTYASLERKRELESEELIWYEDLPQNFKCSCTKVEYDLKYIKENLHALLRHQDFSEPGISFSELYDYDTLNKILINFKKLLDEDSSEQEVQEYIEAYPIILQQFSPMKLFFKKSIMGIFKTDFCIVNNKNELLLIEIEKPNTPLLKQDGGIRADLQHPVDQVRDWLYLSGEERSAVLKGLGLKPDDVNKIRGIVICGRDAGYDSEHLRKLKGQNFGEIIFYTYDDILNGLNSILKSLKDL